MTLATALDRLVPAPGSPIDAVAAVAHQALGRLAAAPAGEPVVRALRGDALPGRALHPYVVGIPTGAWLLAGWYDRQDARGDAAASGRADRALTVGLAGALLAWPTGQAQFLLTHGAARREAALHAALNSVALGFQLGSLQARSVGRRRLGRALSLTALAVLPVSGVLGADVATRLGRGLPIPALRRTRLAAVPRFNVGAAP